MDQYVCVRITSMTGMDINLFERDWHNALYYFIMNADEYIYMRYGGRDAEAPDKYLDMNSLELALKQGLEQHERYNEGKLPPQERPELLYPREIPLLKKEVIEAGRCVECHLVGDYKLQQKELEGRFNPIEDLYAYPDINTIGIELDIPKGLVVKETSGAVAEAGMRAGDKIARLDGTRVFTFGDLQHAYSKTPRDAEQVTFAVERNGEINDLTVDLPKEWWLTDLFHRFLSVEPQLYFEARPLTREEKLEYGFDPGGFASEVTHVSGSSRAYMLHELEEGDLIYAVDGVEKDDMTDRVDVYIKLNKPSGEYFTLKLLRDGEKLEMEARGRRERFRK